MVILNFMQCGLDRQATSEFPNSLNMGFLGLLQLPFVSIMIKIKAEILNTNSGNCHLLSLKMSYIIYMFSHWNKISQFDKIYIRFLRSIYIVFYL